MNVLLFTVTHCKNVFLDFPASNLRRNGSAVDDLHEGGGLQRSMRPQSCSDSAPRRRGSRRGLRNVCVHLEEVDLGNVTKIGREALVNCRFLVHLRLPHTVVESTDEGFWRCSGLERTDLGNVTKISCLAFARCSLLVHLQLPAAVTKIGRGAFIHCKLQEVDLSHLELQKIEKETFKECCQLRTVTLPSTLETIGDRVFTDCKSLKRVGLHNGLKGIVLGAFQGAGLESLTIPSSLRVIGGGYFPVASL
ncbi:hypothetical protein ACHAWF_014677 [Thalassiosira exigua]